MNYRTYCIILLSGTFVFGSSTKASFHKTYANSFIKPHTPHFQILHDINIWEDDRYTNETSLNFEYFGEDQSGIFFNLPYTFKTNSYDKNSGFGDIELGFYFTNNQVGSMFTRYDFSYKRTIIGDYISPVIMGNITEQHIGGISYSLDLDKFQKLFITSRLEYLYVSGTSVEFESDPGWPDFIDPKHVFNFNADVIIGDLLPKNISILAGFNYHYSSTRVELTNINNVSNYIGESISIGNEEYYPTEQQASSFGVKCEVVYRLLNTADISVKANFNLYDNFNSPNSINIGVSFLNFNLFK